VDEEDKEAMNKRKQKRIERHLEVTEKMIQNAINGPPGKIQSKLVTDLTKFATSLRNQLLEGMKEV
jgi:hypothetical protein